MGQGLSNLGGGGGGGGGDSKFSNSSVGFQNYKTGADALGEQGKPISMTQSALNANPHYDKTGEYSEFTQNCQRCVIANEARRRGHDVTAQPTYDGDTMPVNNKYIHEAFVNPKIEHVGGRTKQAAQKNFEDKVLSYGEGARATMAFGWSKGNSGHVISVEVKNGKVHYLDPQVGGKYDGARLFGNIKHNDIRVTRVDNLEFADGIKAIVTKDKW